MAGSHPSGLPQVCAACPQRGRKSGGRTGLALFSRQRPQLLGQPVQLNSQLPAGHARPLGRQLLQTSHAFMPQPTHAMHHSQLPVVQSTCGPVSQSPTCGLDVELDTIVKIKRTQTVDCHMQMGALCMSCTHIHIHSSIQHCWHWHWHWQQQQKSKQVPNPKP